MLLELLYMPDSIGSKFKYSTLIYFKKNIYVPICLVILVLVQFTHTKYIHISQVEIL